MMKQRAFAVRSDARNFLQPTLANIALAPGPMRADGKPVRLVAQPLDKIQQGIARRQPERVTPGDEERLPPGIAIDTLGDGDQRHIGDTERSQCFASRGKLAL